MRYTSAAPRLDIVSTNGSVLHRFYNNVLVIGDPTLGTAGNVIPANTGLTDPNLDYMIVVPGGATDLDKIGRNVTFWETPVLTNAATLVAGSWYQVLSATITYMTVVYYPGQFFQCVTGNLSFTGSGTICLDIPHEYKKEKEHNQRSQSFAIDHLAVGDESSWFDPDYGATLDSSLGAVR